MCLAIPGKVVSIEGKIADVDFGGVSKKVNLSMVEVEVGEWVIVHAGFAIQTMDEQEALETLKLWEELLAQNEDLNDEQPLA
ncbi:MAG TPA: HypC/HybG/HupF family hydrogenase formation chaperone [Methanomassiliicoccales archaeon]|jgi:hydrogenase expression/formation protein HypC|nr:HypC/HybG/HupF family hydrogenase formation chaperone [Methanomassiliicoccales archaeon]